MALSLAQKNKILQLLGYPGKSLDVDSVLYDKVLSDRLVSLTSETQSLVVTYLENIDVIETQIAAAPKRFIATKVGDIELNDREIEKLRKERKLQTRELGVMLDIPMLSGGSGMISVVC